MRTLRFTSFLCASIQLAVSAICLFVILPLTLVGTVLGRNMSGQGDYPCRWDRRSNPRVFPLTSFLALWLFYFFYFYFYSLGSLVLFHVMRVLASLSLEVDWHTITDHIDCCHTGHCDLLICFVIIDWFLFFFPEWTRCRVRSPTRSGSCSRGWSAWPEEYCRLDRSSLKCPHFSFFVLHFYHATVNYLSSLLVFVVCALNSVWQWNAGVPEILICNFLIHNAQLYPVVM